MCDRPAGEPKQLRYFKPGERIVLNGHKCEVERQTRRSTFVRCVAGEFKGAVVQLDKKGFVRGLPKGAG